MIYFTADLHFYHGNIIRATNRPFRDADEMNRTLIQKWNERVNFDDEIYILGDFTMKGPELATAILSGLKGTKHLIKGNHDGFAGRATFDRSQFTSIRDYAEITYANTMLVLCHYPILEWNGYHRGSMMLHGHQHNPPEYNHENRKKGILRYDVGVDANDMAPVSAEEVTAFFAGS